MAKLQISDNETLSKVDFVILICTKVFSRQRLFFHYFQKLARASNFLGL